MTHGVEDVVDRHIACYLKRDVDGLAADYADDAVMVTKATGVVKGREAIRQTFVSIFRDVFPPGNTAFEFDSPIVAGNTALVHWSAATPQFRTIGAFDSFYIQDGKIVSQTGGGVVEPITKD